MELYNKVIQKKHDIWYDIVQQQFDLVYVGNFSYQDTENMSPHERKTFYSLLAEQKREEREAIEAARRQKT